MENQAFADNSNRAPIETTGSWIVTLLIASIPIVGFIMLLVWAFGSGTNPNKANFAKASLIWAAIVLAIGVVFMGIFGLAFLNLANS